MALYDVRGKEWRSPCSLPYLGNIGAAACLLVLSFPWSLGPSWGLDACPWCCTLLQSRWLSLFEAPVSCCSVPIPPSGRHLRGWWGWHHGLPGPPQRSPCHHGFLWLLGTAQEWHPSVAGKHLGSSWLQMASVRIEAFPCESWTLSRVMLHEWDVSVRMPSRHLLWCRWLLRPVREWSPQQSSAYGALWWWLCSSCLDPDIPLLLCLASSEMSLKRPKVLAQPAPWWFPLLSDNPVLCRWPPLIRLAPSSWHVLLASL